MKALTIHQPWATLIAVGAKRIETRSWATKYRGPLAIHAAASPETWAVLDDPDLMSERQTIQAVLAALGLIGTDGAWPSPWVREDAIRLGDLSLPLGAVVATCTLVDVVRITANTSWFRDLGFADLLDSGVTQEAAFGDFTAGRYAWLLADVVPLDPPVPAKGRQGLFGLPEEVSRGIRAATPPTG